MYFKRIELNGFKSFADPVTIELTDGITCIVGPNGSGKSNISDALRWVLGEQSPKSLRGGKMEDVIFAGTQTRKAKGMAEVTLVIDNSEHQLPLDFNEIGITRRMYRSGESEYMINRTPCRLRDIRELIMDTGIGVEGYSIIGQGRIADIVSNKMESRREIFEEAAGIVKYRTRKEAAEKNLQSAEGNLARVNDIVYEIEGRIDGLREGSEKAIEYLDISEKYKGVEINIILRNIQAAQSRTDAAEAELDALVQRLEDLHRERDELDASLGESRSKAAALEERINGLRDDLLKKTEEIHFITGRSELNQEKKLALDKDDERLLGEIEQLKDRIAKQQENRTAIENSQAEAEEKAKSYEAALEEKKEAFRQANQALISGQQAYEAQRNLVFTLSGSENAANLEIQSMESLKGSLKRRAEHLQNDEGSSAEGLKELEDRLEEKNKSGQAVLEAEERLRKSQAEAEEIIKAAELKQADIRSKAQDLGLRQGQVQARLKLLEELESSYEGYGGAVRYIMKKGLFGIQGVLGDMIEVPRGWELAIETVLGAQMQNIVCDDDDTAKRAIDMLKRDKAGRLTFLPLRSLKPGQPADVETLRNEPGFQGLAADEVGFTVGEDKLADYLLGRVVVVDTLENAIRMSKKG